MKFFISTVLVVLVFSVVQAQFEPTTVQKSAKIIRYQGVEYYLHTVRSGHTLFRICQVYGVTDKDIEKVNPEVVLTPLSVGTILRIPIFTNTPISSAEEKPEDDAQFIFHKVEPTENVYSLSKKYNVPEELIYKYNPSSKISIQLGEVIKIPIGKELTEKETTIQIPEEQEILHHVKQGDTLYRIAKIYDISITDLINSNPELRWGLKTGQTIKIPNTMGIPWAGMQSVNDSIFTINEFKGFSKYQCDSIKALANMRPPIKVVMLLPFFSEDYVEEEQSQTDSLGNIIKPKKKNLKGRVAAEFYEGFLLSLDTLKKMGRNISSFVYDTEADTNKVKLILRELDIVEPDIIIGPLSPDNIKLVSQFSFERKIPFMPPLTTNDKLFIDNPSSLRVIPSEIAEQEAYSTYLSKMDNKNLVLVYQNNLKYQPKVASFKKMLLEKLAVSPYQDTIRLSEVFIDDTLNINLEKALQMEKENIVFIISSYEPDVINTISRLHFLMREIPIEVFGMPDWRKFDNIRVDVLHELQTTVYTPFYINYQDADVIDFVEKCRNSLGYEPFMTTKKGAAGINYSFLGYDLGMYSIEALYNYGDNLCDCTESMDSNFLLSDYNFKRNKITGINENSSIRFIRYNKEYINEEIFIDPEY